VYFLLGGILLLFTPTTTSRVFLSESLVADGMAHQGRGKTSNQAKRKLARKESITKQKQLCTIDVVALAVVVRQNLRRKIV
jgi:hypothetical protein